MLGSRTGLAGMVMGEWYEDEVRALEASALPPPRTAVLFYGSSSIRLWSRVDDDFSGHAVVNRGFGGATLFECVRCFDRLVRPVAPQALVLYAGDNDLDQGASPQDVLTRFRAFAALVATLPPMPWAFVSIKLSPSRRHLDHNIQNANALVRSEIRLIPGATYIDVFSSMLDESVEPPFKYFSDDWLHLNSNGYALWAASIRPWIDALPSLSTS